MKLTRRSLLASVGGAAASMASLAVFGQAQQDPQTLLTEWSNHDEEFHVSVCQQCPGGCGILARVVDGRLVKLAGNPLHPVNQGGLCMKGLAGTQVLYDPDRIRSPLARDGKRGQHRWKPIGWPEALQRVASRLQELRTGGKAHTVALLGGQYRGLVDPLMARFCRAYGTPNYLRLRCQSAGQPSIAAHYQQGLDAPLCYDLAHSRYILSFGCNLLESWTSTVHQQMIYGQLRDHPGGERVQVVVVDPRYSVTAAKADLWLPLRPGTDAALAMGLAHIIIQEGRYDTDFVRDRCFGFEDWQDDDGTRHQGFRTLALEEYPPESVSEVTGIPVERLFQVARGLATARPAVVLGDRGPAYQASDLYTRLAIHSLNALVGSIGQAGGVVRQGSLPLAPWPDFQPDGVARAGLAHRRIDSPPERPPLFGEHTAHRLPAAVAAGDPYELGALFLYYTNPLFAWPDQEAWLHALEKTPFIVSFSPFMDESTRHADLILPDCTYLERWRDDEITHLAGISAFSIGAPVVPPVHDTRATEDVLLELAGRLGGPVAAALPWKQYSDLLRAKARGLHQARRGHIVMPAQQEEFEAILARQGYWEQTYPTFEAFWAQLLHKGVWWDPNDSYIGPHQLIQTPTFRFEFYSQALRAELEAAARHRAPAPGGNTAPAVDRLAAELGIQARGDRLFLPHDEPRAAASGADGDRFVLNTYKLLSLAGGRGANQPWLEQEPAVHLDGGWDSWVEINPGVAAELGIEDGDPVWVETAAGRIQVTARLYPGAAPNVLTMPYGWGHRAYGRWARDRGQNPNDVLSSRTDPARGLPAWSGTPARLRKA